MAHDCFRNTIELEDMHAAGKLSDDDMKALMIDVVDYCFDFLMELCSPLGPDLIENLKRRDELPEWNDPVPMIRRHLERRTPRNTPRHIPRDTPSFRIHTNALGGEERNRQAS